MFFAKRKRLPTVQMEINSVVKVHFCMFFTRTAALEKKLVFIERREKEETAALENMVHMVEKNLELTTVSSHGRPHCL